MEKMCGWWGCGSIRTSSGVSYIAASLLLVLVAVSASAVIYVYVGGLGHRTERAGQGGGLSASLLVEEVEARTGYRATIKISNPSGLDITDYPVRVVLTPVNFPDYARLSSGILGFTLDSLGKDRLYYWVEWADPIQYVFWVKIPSVQAGGSVTIYLWYGSTSPSWSKYNDPGRVFSFFDGLDSIDTSVWDTSTLGAHVLENGLLTIDYGGLGLKNPLPYNLEDGYCAETRILMPDSSITDYGGTLPEMSSSEFTRSGNGNADATIFMMRAYGNGNTAVHYWVGSGSTSGYDIANDKYVDDTSNAAWYIASTCVNSTGYKLMLNYNLKASASGITWAKECTISL